MYSIFKHAHSGFAYLALIMIFISFLFALSRYFEKKSFNKAHKMLFLITLILSHTQMLLGIFLYMKSPLGMRLISKLNMSDSIQRFYAIEHPFAMLIGLALITIGYSRSKKVNGDQKKFLQIMAGYGIGFLIIIARIPWGAWQS